MPLTTKAGDSSTASAEAHGRDNRLWIEIVKDAIPRHPAGGSQDMTYILSKMASIETAPSVHLSADIERDQAIRGRALCAEDRSPTPFSLLNLAIHLWPGLLGAAFARLAGVILAVSPGTHPPANQQQARKVTTIRHQRRTAVTSTMLYPGKLRIARRAPLSNLKISGWCDLETY